MEHLRVSEAGKSSPKREFRSSRGRVLHRSSGLIRSNILESVAQVNGGSVVVSEATGEDGVVRMKLLVKKQDLKQMLEIVRGGKGGSNLVNGHYQSSRSPSFSSSSSSLEQRLNLLRRRHLSRGNAAAKEGLRRHWIPALQSIPEEH